MTSRFEECDCSNTVYSNLTLYGAHGASKSIIVPTLTTSNPEIFWYACPHSLPEWMEPRRQKPIKKCWLE